MGVRENLVNWMAARHRAFAYSNDKPGKLSPDATRYSDCSGTIYSAYASQGIRIGTMSYEQAENGRRIAQGTTPTQFAQISGYLRQGDIVAMALRHGVGSGSRINHVEMYAGDGNSWGHGGMPGEARGPNLHSIYGRWLLQDAAFWVVQRIVEDEPTTNPQEYEENELNSEEKRQLAETADSVSKLKYALDNSILPLLKKFHAETDKDTYARENIVLPTLTALNAGRVQESSRLDALEAELKALKTAVLGTVDLDKKETTK